jgi:hypothetical protein
VNDLQYDKNDESYQNQTELIHQIDKICTEDLETFKKIISKSCLAAIP